MINSMAAVVDPNKGGPIESTDNSKSDNGNKIILPAENNSAAAAPKPPVAMPPAPAVPTNNNSKSANESVPIVNNSNSKSANESVLIVNNSNSKSANESVPIVNNSNSKSANESVPAVNNNNSKSANAPVVNEPAAETANSTPVTTTEKPFFYSTQKDFWNGPNANYKIMQFLSAFPLTGFLGLDHYYLRSPISGLLKMIVNILTFGLWYLYDAAQIFGEEELVRKNGLSYPLIGSLGLGAGIFTGGGAPTQNGGGSTSPSPLMFLLYCLCVLVPLPFALDHFIVGDTKGGIMKLIMNFGVGFPLIFFGGFILIFFAIFWSMLSTFRLYFQTEDILNNGIVRVFPATIFMDKYFCTKLGPDPNCGGDAEDSKGFFSILIDSFKSMTGSLQQIPIIGSFAGAATKAANAAVATAATTASGLVTAGTTAATLVPQIGSEVLQEANKFSNINQYIQPKKQSGGGSTDETAGPIIFIALAVTAAIGVFMAKFRNLDTIDVLPRSVPTLIRSFLGTKRSYFPSTVDDSPPITGAI